MKTINITEGVNLRLIEGNKFTHTTLSILFRQELSKQLVTADSLLSFMLLSGNSRCKDRRLLEVRLEEMEGAVLDTSVIKKGNEHIIQIYAKFLPCYTEDMFLVLGDVIFKPLLKNGTIEKNILKSIIEGQLNNKREYAFSRFMEKIYGDINGDGYVEDIEKVNIESHYKYVINNSIVEIMAVCANGNAVEQAVKKHFSFQPRNRRLMSINKLRPLKHRLTEESDVIQGKLCVGIGCNFKPTGIDYARVIVANYVFGGSASSHLFMEAREKENLCYYITSRIFRFSSLITVEAGIDGNNMDKTIEIINNTIDSMDASKSEIELSKRNIVNNYKTALDKPDALLNIYINQIIAGDERSIDDIIECISSVDTIDGVFKDLKAESAYMLRGGV